MTAEQSDVIVWEPHDFWARALRRVVSRDTVVESRSELVGPHSDTTSCGVLVHVWDVSRTSGGEVGRSVLRQRQRETRCLMLAAVRAGDHGRDIWDLRELGIAAVWSHVWELPVIGRLINRYVSSARENDQPLEDEIWNNLPWPAAMSRSV